MDFINLKSLKIILIFQISWFNHKDAEVPATNKRWSHDTGWPLTSYTWLCCSCTVAHTSVPFQGTRTTWPCLIGWVVSIDLRIEIDMVYLCVLYLERDQFFIIIIYKKNIVRQYYQVCQAEATCTGNLERTQLQYNFSYNLRSIL